MDQTEQNEPHRKYVIDYILVDENTLKQMEEIIVDEEGTHRIGGKNESDHNIILDLSHRHQNEQGQGKNNSLEKLSEES